ncbi:MAG: hypothetical protein HQL69_18515 [Magnetococcales bacterium]|nr:hypothetical protein [Magnetococcales bacterium]
MGIPDWMKEENEKAQKQADNGGRANAKAPHLVKQKSKQKNEVIVRSVKGLRIQKPLQMQFDELVFRQKQAGGMTGPELAEEAIRLLLKKYKVKPQC